MRRKVLHPAGLALCAAAFVLAPLPGQASLNNEQRKALAHSFVDKLKALYESEKKRSTPSLDSVPEGEELLLQPRLKGLPFADNVYSIKHNGVPFVAFQDFLDILYFAIKYDPDTRNADGWFLREDWHFNMDFAANKVVSKDKTYSLSDRDVYIHDDKLFVSVESLQLWFGIGIEPDLNTQTLALKSDYPFPIQSHQRRFDRLQQFEDDRNQPVGPLVETDYKWLDVKSAQVSASTNLRRRPEEPQEHSSEANAVIQGQALKHSVYTTVASDNDNGVHSVTGRLYKENLEPDLLGPLKARAYYIGDITQTTIPLTPSGGQDLGVSVTNQRKYEQYDLSSTVIQGNATPGWDVELHRNNGLVDVITVGDDGRYNFENVQLFAGENDFELLFFGPQGEIRREAIYLPVDQNVIAQKGGTYDFAAAISETQTYQKNQSEDIDEGTPSVSGRYNYLLGDVLNYVGFRNLSMAGQDKTYLSTGLITTALSTVIDANATIDEQGEGKVATQLRRAFGYIDVSLNALAGTDGFMLSEGEENPTVHQVGAAARSPIRFLPGRKNTIFLGTGYGESADGDTVQNHNASLASNYGGLNVTHSYDYSKSSDGEAQQQYSPSVSGREGKIFWRASANYGVAPQAGLENVFLDLKYRHSDEWTGDFQLDHNPRDQYSEYEIGANWNHDKFVLRPFVNYDTEHELYTGVSMRFGLINPPGEGLPVMTGRNFTGEGFVSAFVYLDKNGDTVFNGDDEPLPNVLVRSLNVTRKALTDEKGMALLNSLPSTRQTDINVDPNTFPDPFMISRFKPISVAVKPGEIIEMEMPVQYAGELDGTLWLSKKGGVNDVARSRIALVPLEDNENATIQSEALSDGFFVFSLIPPGRYFMVVNPLDAKEYDARRPAPRLIDIGYDAPVLYGQDVVLKEGIKDIDFDVLSESEALTLGLAPVQDRRNAEPLYLLRVEKENSSKLLSLLYAFNSKKLASSYLNDLQKLEVTGPDQEKITRYYAPERSLEKAYERCALIVQSGLPCSVEAVLPPSESFAVKSKGIITTENTASLGKAEKL